MRSRTDREPRCEASVVSAELPPQSVEWALIGCQAGSVTALLVLPARQGWNYSFITLGMGAIALIVGAILIFRSLRALRTNFAVSPQPKASSRLITSGIFRFVRHPMYLGFFLLVGGVCLARGSLLHFLPAFFTISSTVILANIEEVYLQRKFDKYQFYAEKTGKFVPRLTRAS